MATFLSGYKTYLGAAGLTLLAVYQFSMAQYVPAFQSIMAALTVVGLRHAITKGTGA